MVFQILQKKQGVSAKSGNFYCVLTLRSKSEKGSEIKDFFVSEEVARDMDADGVEEDDFVVVEVKLNDYLKFEIVSVLKADDTSSSNAFLKGGM